MSDTSTIVVICVGAVVVGVCLAASLLAGLLDLAWRRWCDPDALADDALADPATASDDTATDIDSAAATDIDPAAATDIDPAAATAREELGTAAQTDPHVPYHICAVCGAPALFPDNIGGVAPPFDWEGDWPPPPPRERSMTH